MLPGGKRRLSVFYIQPKSPDKPFGLAPQNPQRSRPLDRPRTSLSYPPVQADPPRNPQSRFCPEYLLPLKPLSPRPFFPLAKYRSTKSPHGGVRSTRSFRTPSPPDTYQPQILILPSPSETHRHREWKRPDICRPGRVKPQWILDSADD